MVRTVSPSYALEIRKFGRKPEFCSREGLESDLKQAGGQNRLAGIFKGCNYEESQKSSEQDYFDMLSVFMASVLQWGGMKCDK